tara:strand:+ start:700 stop:975 length:276 start_codon:yes stop_codon:yes gene_type:complete
MRDAAEVRVVACRNDVASRWSGTAGHGILGNGFLKVEDSMGEFLSVDVLCNLVELAVEQAERAQCINTAANGSVGSPQRTGARFAPGFIDV